MKGRAVFGTLSFLLAAIGIVPTAWFFIEEATSKYLNEAELIIYGVFILLCGINLIFVIRNKFWKSNFDTPKFKPLGWILVFIGGLTAVISALATYEIAMFKNPDELPLAVGILIGSISTCLFHVGVLRTKKHQEALLDDFDELGGLD